MSPKSLLLLILASSSCFAAQDSSLPHLEKRGNVTQLIVQGQPYLILGGEVHNSSSSGRDYMRPVWPRLAAMHMNTVLTPVSWQQIEPREGQFNFTLLDGLLQDARASHLHLILLWMGSWKNLISSYTPAWVRADTKRFPLALDWDNNPLPILSTFGQESQKADGAAFSALMTHLRKVDSAEHTVIMIQTENEMGVSAGVRDQSDAAKQAFAQNVPAALIDYLTKHKDNLSREMRDAWSAYGSKTSGSWEDIFGHGPKCNEIFMAWNYARYMSGVLAAGHNIWPIPLYLNVDLGKQDNVVITYPSGGAIPLCLDVWHAGAPRIAILSPDIYGGSFTGWCEEYLQSGNPLFIPETRDGDIGAAHAFLAFGHYGAMGFSPFGVDGPGFGTPQFLRAYSLLQQLSPLILKHQSDGSIDAVLLDDNDRSKTIQLGNYSLNIELERSWMTGQPMTNLGAGYAIIIAEPDDTYTIAGRAVQITFATKPGAPVQTVGLDSVEDGSFINGQWTPSRRLNGDEITLTRQFSEQAAIHQDTTGVRLEPDGPNIIRASVFPVK